jgi:hypothetical protein
VRRKPSSATGRFIGIDMPGAKGTEVRWYEHLD